jgi:hypothetical protein
VIARSELAAIAAPARWCLLHLAIVMHGREVDNVYNGDDCQHGRTNLAVTRGDT